MSATPASADSTLSRRKFLAPLALAQFICSFAGSNMNVMINDITEDLDTTVQGVQAAITLFLLIMAILMIPCSKLTDRWGRKRCFTAGLVLYGIGALLSAVSPGLGLLILGNSVFEGVGTALLIPPVASRSSSPSSCKRSAATTRSRRASSSPRPRSVSWSRRWPRNDSPSGVRRRP